MDVNHCILQRLRPAHPVLRIPLAIPHRMREDRLDIFHAQHVVPPFLKCKTITTIPDIAYEHYPEFFPYFQRTWLKLLVRSSARNSDHIITVSEHSKQDIIQTYGVCDEKITVTYEAAGREFFPRDKEKAREEIACKYGIGVNFVLYLGRLQGRKNLARLVEAYARVRRAGFHHKLVLAGKRDSLFQPVMARIRELHLENDVVLPGYIRAEDVPTLYSAADIFVYPSLYEGFGLPVLEAMACGVPVITSRGSSLEEVAGDAAVLVDPLSESSIYTALEQVLGDVALRTRLSQAGLTRNREFDFKRTAQQTMQVYETV
jgi:glycosyltransferase involved in cell wall biosynthesis